MKRIPVGTMIIGPEGLGIVKEHVAMHDIFVELNNGGSALYCQNKKCRFYEAVYPLPKNTKVIKKPLSNKRALRNGQL